VRLSGHHDLSEIIGRSVLEWTADAEKEKNATAIKEALEKGYIRNLEIDYIDSTGKLTPIEINATTMEKEGRIQTITICRDITERKRAEVALRESETRFRKEQEFSQLLLDTSPALIVAIGFDGKTLMMNQALLDILEYTNEEIVGTEYLDTFVPEEDRSILAGVFQQIINEGKATVNENRIISKSGQAYLVEWHGRTVIRKKGDAGFFVGVGIDITEHKRAEGALRASEEKYRELVENANSIILRMDIMGTITFFNEYASRFLGFSRDEIVGCNVVGTIVPSTDSAGNNLALMIHNIGAHPDQYKNNENENMCKDGKRVWVAWTNKPIFDDQGKCIEVLCIGNDITDLKRAEEEMLTAHRLLASVFDSIPDLINVVDREYRIHYTNDKAHNLGKYLELEKQKVCYSRFKLLDRPCEGCIAQPVFETGSVCEKEVYNPADQTFAEVRAYPVLDSMGRVELVVKHVRDITERKRIEEEKEHLQEQLAQAQKLEFVGRLAGGVAHDFNNMLSVILGHTELALLEVGPEQALHDNLEEVHKAAEHSADLTRQLLAFARKQTIAPRILELNETIEGMLMVLRRLIGEDIDLAWVPDIDLWQAKIDPAQIDQILVNLLINARDAIDGVGKVTIETKNVDFDEVYCAMHFGYMPGKYVKLSVSDTGSGMDQETQAHIFEPFFTTKETGKGTGLGMAMVYGIVKQNNGFISVYSEPGRGTTFAICLPRYTGKTVVISEEGPVEAPKGGPETVLLVEDEPSILKLGKTILEGLDYRVLTAGTPGEAICLAEKHAGEIHLLISDVVMPEMNGRDLAKKLLSLYPNLKRLFMSGYTANVIAHHGILDEGVYFIQKPFSIKNLAAKVREVLDQE
jgi:two-component system cell cycle sensor histidine kinase/response regulator CckA